MVEHAPGGRLTGSIGHNECGVEVSNVVKLVAIRGLCFFSSRYFFRMSSYD